MASLDDFERVDELAYSTQAEAVLWAIGEVKYSTPLSLSFNDFSLAFNIYLFVQVLTLFQSFYNLTPFLLTFANYL